MNADTASLYTWPPRPDSNNFPVRATARFSRFFRFCCCFCYRFFCCFSFDLRPSTFGPASQQPFDLPQHPLDGDDDAEDGEEYPVAPERDLPGFAEGPLEGSQGVWESGDFVECEGDVRFIWWPSRLR